MFEIIAGTLYSPILSLTLSVQVAGITHHTTHKINSTICCIAVKTVKVEKLVSRVHREPLYSQPSVIYQLRNTKQPLCNHARLMSWWIRSSVLMFPRGSQEGLRSLKSSTLPDCSRGRHVTNEIQVWGWKVGPIIHPVNER